MNTKHRMIVIGLVALFGLACLESAGSASLKVAMVATVTASPEMTVRAGAVASPEVTVAAERVSCAVVVADTALNLRSVAGGGGDVLAWLRRGDVLQVLDSTSGEWWRVTGDAGAGWVRAEYLQGVECVK